MNLKIVFFFAENYENRFLLISVRETRVKKAWKLWGN